MNTKFYDDLQKALMFWVWNNKKMLHKITPHNLKFLFEFDKQRGLSIDLRRFEPDYYNEVFFPPRKKNKNIDEFTRKVCLIISQNLKQLGKQEISITITVRHMVSEISHWKTFYIDNRQHEKPVAPLTEKETDWHYSYATKPNLSD